MHEALNAKQLRERLKEVIEKMRRGEKLTVLYRSRPAFDIVPIGTPSVEIVHLESDSLYRAGPVGSSGSGDAAVKHDDLLYR